MNRICDRCGRIMPIAYPVGSAYVCLPCIEPLVEEMKLSGNNNAWHVARSSMRMLGLKNHLLRDVPEGLLMQIKTMARRQKRTQRDVILTALILYIERNEPR